MKQSPYILAIESSCDDTSAAVLKGKQVLVNYIANQQIHENFGGVVPELASRAHQKSILPVVSEALKKANVLPKDLDAIAYTLGPGLMGSLHVGVSFAKGLALALGCKLISVNHMHGHILAHFIENNQQKYPEFPFLCLTVSGGHTQLVLVKSAHNMEIIGQTTDDAVGEAFDKAAKMLDIPYPGGPLIDKLAQQGDYKKFEFPKPEVPNLNFSFSGIKTSLLYFLKKQLAVNNQFITQNKADICASYQYTLVTILLDKLKKAIKQTKVKHIALAGGVSANSLLRSEFLKLAEKNQLSAFIPPLEYCTDNAAMIGIAGYYKYINKEFSNFNEAPQARLLF